MPAPSAPGLTALVVRQPRSERHETFPLTSPRGARPVPQPSRLVHTSVAQLRPPPLPQLPCPSSVLLPLHARKCSRDPCPASPDSLLPGVGAAVSRVLLGGSVSPGRLSCPSPLPQPLLSPVWVPWGRQASWASSRSVSVPSFQMYQKERQVLEELGQHTGARLQPLSRGLY